MNKRKYTIDEIEPTIERLQRLAEDAYRDLYDVIGTIGELMLAVKEYKEQHEPERQAGNEGQGR